MVTTQAGPARSKEADLAESLAWLVGDIDAMQSVFGQGTEAMVEASASADALAYLPPWFIAGDGETSTFDISWNPGLLTAAGIPAGFFEPLSDTGKIDAPPGACPAGAKPQVAFTTGAGEAVTSGLLASKDLRTLDKDYFVRLPDSAGPEVGLQQVMLGLVTGAGDPRRLATTEGWNEVLWDQMKALQLPARSLMDYQIWTASSAIEAEVVAGFRDKLNSLGLPSMVVDAFEESNMSGWMANSEPTSADNLARMDIEAELAGSLEGTVYETREMAIPPGGSKPTFGPQTGYGSVAYNHPTDGKIPFEVDILLDQYDDLGRAISGTVTGVSEASGYEFEIRFQDDGTKEGDLFRDGELVGQLSMTVDAERFHNYLNLETSEERQLDKPNR